MDELLVWNETYGMVVYIPAAQIACFKEVIRRGMSFEHGETPQMHRFADKLSVTLAPSGTPLPGTMLL